MDVALRQPHRRKSSNGGRNGPSRKGKGRPDGARDPLLGFALGRLRTQGIISVEQFAAGEHYARLYLRFHSKILNHVPRFPSNAIDDSNVGSSCIADMSEEDAFRLSREWNDALSALEGIRAYHATCTALMMTCVMDYEPRDRVALGALRCGLNVLHKLWSRNVRLHHSTPRPDLR